MMKIENKLRGVLLVAAAVALATPSSADTKEKTGNQTLNQASDVWRVELSHLRNFHVLTTGDGKDGELHKMTVKLSGRDGQWQAVKEDAHYMSARPNTGRTSSYLSISAGGGVTWADDSADYHNYRLWIHQHEFSAGDVGGKQVEFKIDIVSVELDCAGARVCDRQDVGRVSYRGVVPVPELGTWECGLDNTYTVEASEGNVWLRPKTRGPNSIPMRPVGRSGPLIALASNAEVCIAKSDTRPGCDTTDAICRELQRKSAPPVIKKEPITIPKVDPKRAPKLPLKK